MPPQQPQQQGDNSLAALWLTLFFFALAGLVWYLFHTQITWFIVKLKYGEATLVSLFTTSVYPLIGNLQHVDASAVPVRSLGYIMQTVGAYIRYPVAIILVILAAVLFYGHPTLRFKRAHTMKTLLEQERFNWPQIMPVSKVDLVNQHIEKGPWSMALTPMQFAKRNRLIYEERDPNATAPLGKSRGQISVGLLRAEAHQVFSVQLGAYWQGVEKLSPYAKALFAVFACRAHRDQDTAKAILDQMAISSVEGHLDFTGVDDVVNKYKDSALVKGVTDKHAFVMTVMASMLELAREDGVLASADFLWLKLIDRPLWFMLNSIGRQTPPTEISGAFAHWLAEKKLGRRISVPMVDEAVKALDIGLKDVIYVPDEQV